MNEKKLLIQLLQKNKIELNTLDSISNVDLTKFIKKYESKNILEYSYGIIKLTESGKNLLLEQRKSIFLSKSDKPWLQIPEEMKIQSIEINKQTNI